MKKFLLSLLVLSLTLGGEACASRWAAKRKGSHTDNTDTEENIRSITLINHAHYRATFTLLDPSGGYITTRTLEPGGSISINGFFVGQVITNFERNNVSAPDIFIYRRAGEHSSFIRGTFITISHTDDEGNVTFGLEATGVED